MTVQTFFHSTGTSPDWQMLWNSSKVYQQRYGYRLKGMIETSQLFPTPFLQILITKGHSSSRKQMDNQSYLQILLTTQAYKIQRPECYFFNLIPAAIRGSGADSKNHIGF